MNPGDTIDIAGLAQLQEAMRQLAPKLQQNVMRAALRAGAKVIAVQAKAIAPVEGANTYSKYKVTLGWKPGALEKSIRINAKIVGDTIVGRVMAGSKVAYYANMVEKGTSAHWERPKGAKSLFIAGLYKEAVYHPGARANPFMKIALDSQAQKAAERVGEYIRGRLTKEGIEISDDGDNSI